MQPAKRCLKKQDKAEKRTNSDEWMDKMSGRSEVTFVSTVLFRPSHHPLIALASSLCKVVVP